jgi:hypothetical protein
MDDIWWFCVAAITSTFTLILGYGISDAIWQKKLDYIRFVNDAYAVCLKKKETSEGKNDKLQ